MGLKEPAKRISICPYFIYVTSFHYGGGWVFFSALPSKKKKNEFTLIPLKYLYNQPFWFHHVEKLLQEDSNHELSMGRGKLKGLIFFLKTVHKKTRKGNKEENR